MTAKSVKFTYRGNFHAYGILNIMYIKLHKYRVHLIPTK